MKARLKTVAGALALAIHLSPFALHLHAAVPLAWEVWPGRPAPVTFDRYHGERLELAAAFRWFGELPFAEGADVRLWWQTNGMGSAWWSAPATVSSNVVSAVWSPALDPGADRVSLFFGAPSNAYAAAVLRLRHSPGFHPTPLPDPATFREEDPVFAAWLPAFASATNDLQSSILNLQSGTNNLQSQILNLQSATNDLQASILSLQSGTNSLSARIAALEAQLAGLENALHLVNTGTNLVSSPQH